MKLTIKEYMEKYGIRSKQTVYNKIKAGEIKKVKEGTRIFIIIKDDKPGIDKEINLDVQELLKEIKQEREEKDSYINELKEQMKELKKDKDNLNERLREANILNLNNVEAIKNLTKNLELKNESTRELTKPKVSWLSRLFKGKNEQEE